MNTSRLFGIMLTLVGIVVGVLAVAWLVTNEDLEGPARVLGLAIALVVLVVPLCGAGIYLLMSGGQQVQAEKQAQQQRRLLDVVQTRGQVKLNELAVELQLPLDQIKDLIHDLVGLGVFSGYINWDDGVLYSSEAAQLQALTQCPNCGGDISLSGKGVASCRFCGTEFFLS